MTISPLPGHAYPYPKWHHLESEHFTLSYTESTAPFAEQSLAAARRTLDTLADFFGFVPKEKIAIVLEDNSDYSNGFTAAKESKVTIYCRNAPGLFREQGVLWHNNVIAHELSHIYTLKQFELPFYLSLGVSVTDTDYNLAATAAATLGHFRLPGWFVEGTAQLGSYTFGTDYRDPYREMLLREHFFNNTLLSLDAMCRFEGTSADYELVYNQGFDFMLFLTTEYPDVSVRSLCRNVAEAGFAKGMLQSYEKSITKLYAEWQVSLSARFRDPGIKPTGMTRLFRAGGLLNIETAAADNGQYVLANWENDYQAYNLWRRKTDGSFTILADRTGRVLKQDRVSGRIWFNRMTYNSRTDTYNFDIFTLDDKDRPVRISEQTRCLAFDVLDDHLYYAHYQAGTTKIIHRQPDGNQTVLYVFPPGQSVFSLSAASHNQLLLGIGEKGGLALLTGYQLRFLWPGQPVTGAVAVGPGRVVFTSTRDGTPQLYLAYLDRPDKHWYQLTSVRGGAFFPAFRDLAGREVLTFSVFEEGNFNLYQWENPFNNPEPVPVPDTRGSDPGPAAIGTETHPVSANWVRGTPVLTTGIALAGALFDPDAVRSLQARAGLDLQLLNAPGNFLLNYFLDMDTFYLLSPEPAAWETVNIATGLSGRFTHRYLLNTVQYRISSRLSFREMRFEDYLNQDAFLAAEFQLLPGILSNRIFYRLASRSLFDEEPAALEMYHYWGLVNQLDISPYQSLNLDTTANWNQDWNEGELDHNSVSLLGTVAWLYSRATGRPFDPAGLGRPYYAFSVTHDQYLIILPAADESGEPAGYSTGIPCSLSKAEVSYKHVLAGGRLSLQGSLGGFGFQCDPAALSILESLLPGVSSAFNGYPAGYARLNNLAQLSLEVRCNPFVEKAGPTHWYERFYLSAALAGGITRYLAGDEPVPGYPLAVTAAYHQVLYLSPESASTLHIRLAVPLSPFNGDIDRPYNLQIDFIL